MKKIIIFAGTCASGKTTVIEKINKEELSLGNEIKIDKNVDWDYIQYKHYQEKIQSNQSHSDYVILHYDIYGQRIVMQNDFQQLSKLVGEFEEVSIVTLTTSSRELRKRIGMRLIKTIVRMLLNPINFKVEAFRCKRHYQIYKNYKNPNTLKNLYGDWFEYTKTLQSDEHWIVNSDRKDEYDIQNGLTFNHLLYN